MSSTCRRSAVYGEVIKGACSVGGDSLASALDFVQQRAGSALGSSTIRAVPDNLSVSSVASLFRALSVSTSRDRYGAVVERSMLESQRQTLHQMLKQEVVEVERARAAMLEERQIQMEAFPPPEDVPEEPSPATAADAAAAAASSSAALSASERLKHRRMGKRRVKLT